jgi:transcriptional regulator with XRE-family HTH domain
LEESGAARRESRIFALEETMRASERARAREKLDKELRWYRRAAREKNPTYELLRTMRRLVNIPVAELARTLGVDRSVLLRMERREIKGTLTMNTMYRVAEAMNCKMVYAIVPRHGWTLAELTEWRRLGKSREQAAPVCGGGEGGVEGLG